MDWPPPPCHRKARDAPWCLSTWSPGGGQKRSGQRRSPWGFSWNYSQWPLPEGGPQVLALQVWLWIYFPVVSLLNDGSVFVFNITMCTLNTVWKEIKSDSSLCMCRSSAELESFHNNIMMYANKRFSPPVYERWILLAGLDYNHHVHRTPKRSLDASLQYVISIINDID